MSKIFRKFLETNGSIYCTLSDERLKKFKGYKLLPHNRPAFNKLTKLERFFLLKRKYVRL